MSRENELEYTKENCGRKCTQYGGTITDMETMPVGTGFYVTNGGWVGRIIDIDSSKYLEIGGCKPRRLKPNDPNNINAINL